MTSKIVFFRNPINNIAIVDRVLFSSSLINLEGIDSTEENYIIVEDIPEVDMSIVTNQFKSAKLMLNVDTNTLFYEYAPRPLTTEEKLSQLEKAVQDLILSGGGL